MVGIVVDLETNKPITAVSITNVHIGKEIFTKDDGKFEVEVNKGELIEFRISGYDVARVQVKSNVLAAYYYIQLRPASTLFENQFKPNYFVDAKIDSIKRRALYAEALDHYKLTGLDIIQHPFDALSKRNKMIWAFQKNYEIWEQDKFVDYVFNDRIIVQLTGLDAASLEEYKRKYRPPYNYIRGMNEYQYYSYIKETVKDYQYKKQKTVPVDDFNHEK